MVYGIEICDLAKISNTNKIQLFQSRVPAVQPYVSNDTLLKDTVTEAT